MTIWVTRTEPGAGLLARLLEQAGYEALVQPVLEIEPLATQEIPVHGDELCVVLSRHAVLAVPAGCGAYLAVGVATRDHLLRERGIQAEVPDIASSEGVVAWMATRKIHRVLLITGAGGRGIIESWAKDAGVPLQVIAAYRRVAAPVSVKTAQIEALEVASGDGVRRAAQVWFAADGDPKVRVIAVSQRVCEVAADCGFLNVSVCAGAAAEDVLQALQQRTRG